MKSLLITLLMSALFITSKAQESTNYWFEGNVYYAQDGNSEKRFSYLPVYLSTQEEPKTPIAVGMTNSIGVISFKGVPIDIQKSYIITLPLPEGEAQFQFYGITNPSFKSGNVTIHMKMDEFPIYKNESILNVAEGDKGKKVIDLISEKFPSIVQKEFSFFNKETKKAMRVYINGYNLTSQKLNNLLDQLTVEMIKNIKVVLLTPPNNYLSGAIDINLTEGASPKITETTFTIKRIK